MKIDSSEDRTGSRNDKLRERQKYMVTLQAAPKVPRTHPSSNLSLPLSPSHPSPVCHHQTYTSPRPRTELRRPPPASLPSIPHHVSPWRLSPWAIFTGRGGVSALTYKSMFRFCLSFQWPLSSTFLKRPSLKVLKGWWSFQDCIWEWSNFGQVQGLMK